MMYIVALILVILFLCNNPKAKKEAYELFGGSGFKRSKALPSSVGTMSAPAGVVEEKVTNATPDLIQTLVRATASAFPNECLFPIETNSINKVGDNYKCSFTFVRYDTGFPTGVVVQSMVDSRTGKLLGAATQSTKTDETTSFTKPLFQYGEVVETLPTADALRDVKI
jgi:hypothetical protein